MKSKLKSLFLSVLVVTKVPTFAGCGNSSSIESTSSGTGGTFETTQTTSMLSGASTTTGGAGGTEQGGGEDCSPPKDADADRDGYSIAEGDCNDCDPFVAPDSAEMPTPDTTSRPAKVDENCNGLFDEISVCDADLKLDSVDPDDAARAIDLCDFVEAGAPFGLVSTRWIQPDYTDLPADKLTAFHLGHGILPDLGPNNLPRLGNRLLALSTGAARRPTDSEYVQSFDKGFVHNHPLTMPFEGKCDAAPTGHPHDGVALELVLKPPRNALLFTFEVRLFTRAWPSVVCTEKNDQFAVFMSPKNTPGLNIAFDKDQEPFVVDRISPFDCACATGCPEFGCEANAPLLEGSGFGASEGFGASTGWLSIAAPVPEDGETFTLRWLAYDAENGTDDTTVTIDKFRWLRPIPHMRDF